jgi:hypothetical protein
VFRSDSKPQALPKISTAAARVALTQSAPDPHGAIVRVDVIGSASWVEARSDGQPVFGQTLMHGESRTFKGNDSVVLFIARSREVRILANGRDLSTPNTPSYRAEFTPATADLPANQWTATPPQKATAHAARASTPSGGVATLPEQPRK